MTDTQCIIYISTISVLFVSSLVLAIWPLVISLILRIKKIFTRKAPPPSVWWAVDFVARHVEGEKNQRKTKEKGFCVHWFDWPISDADIKALYKIPELFGLD